MQDCFEDSKKCYELAKQVLDCQDQAQEQMRIYEVYLDVLLKRKDFASAELVMNDSISTYSQMLLAEGQEADSDPNMCMLLKELLEI